jgi:predicted amidohydrolase YtcJ
MTHTLLRHVASWLLPMAACCAVLAGCRREDPADLVIRGKIATVDTSFSIREAVAVRGGVIVYVGDLAGIDRFVGPETTVIDAGPGLVLPGLVDAHAHMYSYAQELANLNVTGTRSFNEVVARVAERTRTARPGEWVLGGRWDQTDWADTAFPVHDALSAVSPDNPVYLKRVDGNAALANAAALKAAGITRRTADPSGGVIHRKAGGDPSGVLVNRAMDLVEAAVPKDTPGEYERKLLAAIDRAAAFGLTGWHEAGVTPPEIAIYRSLLRRGALKLRCYAMLGDERNPEYQGNLAAYFRANRMEDDSAHMFAVRSVKVFFDGALGSRGAAFYEPYADDPKNVGLVRVSQDHVEKIARAALETGMQVGTHCIGIRGNRLTLEAYEKALRAHPGVDHRFRIEHAQFVEPRDIAKFAGLGVLAAMQPTHATSDMGFVEARVGPERARFGYAWREFLNAGVIIPAGSDFPVESPNPLLGIYAAVTRTDLDGKPDGGWFPAQRMTIQEAIRGFTAWAAFASFRETVLGSIEVGKLADFTILDRDLLSVPPRDIPGARVLFTIVGGRIVHRTEGPRRPAPRP